MMSHGAWMRWSLLGVALAGLAVLLLPGDDALHAQSAPQRTVQSTAPLTEIKVVERVNAAADRALLYLRKKQQPDGSWSPNNNAINALAMLAFMGRGHVPGRGPYKDVLERGKKFILAKARNDGFLGFGSMYEHGLATLALAEMYGMDADPVLEEKLRGAVKLIVHCQSPAGGWRYNPIPADQDLSVTVMQIVALRAARNAGISVPDGCVKKAIQYVKSCASPGGGFGYQGPGNGPQTTAAGILSLQLLGEYKDQTVVKAQKQLSIIPIQWGNGPAAGGPNYFYYFHYYAIQAAYQAGGNEWNAWHPRIRELLLAHQNADGSWEVPPGTTEGSVDPQNKVYSTAMALLVLDIYSHFLPAYQR